MDPIAIILAVAGAAILFLLGAWLHALEKRLDAQDREIQTMRSRQHELRNKLHLDFENIRVDIAERPDRDEIERLIAARITHRRGGD